MVVFRGQLFAGLLLLTGPALAADALSMAAIFQKAADYQSIDRVMALREQAAAERMAAARRFIAGTPSVSLSQKSDRWNKDAGNQEDAVGLTVPLWRWGERQAAMAVASSGSESIQKESEVQRHLLAGQVRDGVWGYLRASLREQVLKGQLEEALKTDADAMRRLEAGDISRVDRLNARMAAQSLQTELVEQANRRFKAERQLIAVTGLSGADMGFGSDVAALSTAINGLAETLPRVEDGQRALESSIEYKQLMARIRHGQDRLRLIQQRGSGSPELSIESTRSRSTFGEPYAQTTTLSLSVPFGGGAAQRAELADLASDLADAEQALMRYQKTFEFGWTTGLAFVSQKQRARDLAKQRSRDAMVILQALTKAAEAGEIDYLERLRAERQTFEAQLAVLDADVDYHQTVSEFLQSMGRKPSGVRQP
jgi:cobalt-zinc-cadmium efflux system outer membrane protein